MIRESLIQPAVRSSLRLPSAGYLASAAATALGGLYFLSTDPLTQGWALWSIVGLGCGWTLAEAWREQRAAG